jgi:hypothetical protein
MESFNLENSQEVPYELKNLDDTHPKENNVDGLKIQLMNHQKTALYHSLLIESNSKYSGDNVEILKSFSTTDKR